MILGVNSDGCRCGPHSGSDAPRAVHPPFPPWHPRTGGFSPFRAGSGCLLCPCRAGGRVCLHLGDHDAKHLPPSEQLGRRSNYLFQDKNNSSNLGAAASLPDDGETRIILARGEEKTPQCGGAQGHVPTAAAPVWDLSCDGGGWSQGEASSPRQHGAQLVGKTVYLPKNAVFQRRRGVKLFDEPRWSG